MASGADVEPSYSALGKRIRPPVIVDLMDRALANDTLLSLAAGFTDNAALPHELVRRHATAVAAAGQRDEPLQYGSNQGRAGLRGQVCRMLAGYPGEDPQVFAPERVLIGNGSQQCLYIAIQTLCDPGDIVLVERPSYFVCLEMFRGMGVEAVGIPCDPAGAVLREGLSDLLARLDASGRRKRVKAVYLVTYNGNPTGRSASSGEKETVAWCLREAGFGIPVIEDAAYRELYFEQPHEAPSVLSQPAFAGFPRLYLGTFTKPFATGLKIGFALCSDPRWLERMLCVKGHHDFGSAHFSQALLERMLEAGDYGPFLAGLRRHYAAKARHLDAALVDAGLPGAGWHWERPSGGLVFWLRGPPGADLRMSGATCARCIDSGVLYVPGDLCFADGEPWNCARLATGSLPPDGLGEAARRFAAAVLAG